jgi:outer membrane receptor protein involved in Fe transport
LLGAFYTNEHTEFDQQILATDATGEPAGMWADLNFPTTYKEYAGFTNVTVQLSERFDIQVGGRLSTNEQSHEETDVGIYVPLILGKPSPLVYPRVTSKDSSFTYLITPRFRLSPDVMIYARLASGYRPVVRT